ncbi:MAG: glutathione-disulfide reductase [Gammaproteobacteria bacterium]|nr:glutathione-disulfide reductase [Gammaproteobacteria bacterium]
MTTYQYDLFVIGAGSGGVRAARMAAGLGKHVAIAEDRDLGGTCVNVGCVPKKLFVYASHFHEEFRAAQGFGWSVQHPAFNWKQLIANKDAEIQRLQGIYDRLLANSGADLINGRATLIDEHTVDVNGQRYSSEHILIATGGWPDIPEIPGQEFIVSSNDMFHLDHLPERMVIVGGGYIGVEFAGIMNGIGVSTTMCVRGDNILRGFDDDIRQILNQEMRKKGIRFNLKTELERIEKNAGELHVELSNGQVLETDLVLFATGRKPNSSGMGLETAGVDMQPSGAIKVDDHYQTSVASIYALGDVTDRLNLTPVATAEAMTLVNHLYSDSNRNVDYTNIPTAVFSQPSVGTVGLSEAQARTNHDDIDIYRSQFTPMKHTLSGIDEKTMMKMVVKRSTDQVLGIHMVGPDAGEIIQGMAVAIRAGATKSIFDTTIGIHPTAAEEFVTMRDPV